MVGAFMKTKKSWREKLADSKDLPRIEVVPERMKSKWGERRGAG